MVTPPAAHEQIGGAGRRQSGPSVKPGSPRTAAVVAITAHFLHRENVRKARCCRKALILLVPEVGLEPTRFLRRRILNSLPCLKTAWLCGLSGLKWTHPAQTLHKSCTDQASFAIASAKCCGARCAYRFVTAGLLCPRISPTVCSGTPACTSHDAQVWRRSCQRQSIPVALRAASHSSRRRLSPIPAAGWRQSPGPWDATAPIAGSASCWTDPAE